LFIWGSPNAYERVASGVFRGSTFNADDFSGLPVELQHKEKFLIVATVIRNGESVNYSTENDTYNAPFNNRSLSSTDEWIHNDAKDYFKDLAGQINPEGINLERGDRFYGEKTFTADYSEENIKIELTRRSVKFKYNITELSIGHKVKLTILRGAFDHLKVKSADITDLENEVFTYPVIKDTDGEDIEVRAEIFDGDKMIKLVKETFTILPRHQYTININANPSKVTGLGIILNDVWEDGDTSITLKEPKPIS